MHWILILTIYSPWGVEIESVGPFLNKKNCNTASNKWLMDMESRKNKYNSGFFSAICVRK